MRPAGNHGPFILALGHPEPESFWPWGTQVQLYWPWGTHGQYILAHPAPPRRAPPRGPRGPLVTRSALRAGVAAPFGPWVVVDLKWLLGRAL
jgi:hypothetical protein